MIRARNLSAAPLLAIVLTSVLLAGCAGRPGVDRRMPECMMPDTLVCYGKRATRLENRNRLEEVEFCRCERALDLR